VKEINLSAWELLKDPRKKELKINPY